jgi:hypothetical protein
MQDGTAASSGLQAGSRPKARSGNGGHSAAPGLIDARTVHKQVLPVYPDLGMALAA